ncbi:hypothetical protein CROQUDRAFT_724044 [Cronartium quercuum f. sp. fusiforme G11]|uniref:Wax synthase domain-containing protein n=1 Tax=Cronartium quercuum f. sp. fusiforme G11 TaxID=708437 RepID=A0A9P6T9Q5_9BASI|nr:hypothetical protein CROQUDRAFT_724044 [Cronartium quercuum f. sp. fusiforme G11]
MVKALLQTLITLTSHILSIIRDHLCETGIGRAFLPLILLFVQAALLHPSFISSKLAKLTRRSLTPIIVFWGLTLPYRYSFKLSNFSIDIVNLGVALLPIWVVIRSLEYGISSEPYYKRPLKNVNGVQRWEKIKDDDESYKKVQESEPCNAFKLTLWTILLLSSMRGLQFTRGPAIVTKRQNILSITRRLFTVNILQIFALVFILMIRDSSHQSPASILLSIGIPKFPGMKILSEGVYTLAFGVWVASGLDLLFTYGVLQATLYHQIAIFLNLPQEILDLSDPIYYPPIFDSPYLANSVAEFWSKRWQMLGQQLFVFSGGKPMVWFVKKIGADKKIQRIFLLLGVFASSAVIHEYLAYTLAPHDVSLHPLKSFPGSAFYFMLQPLAILIEPVIIPWIPKRLGGGTLWLWAFMGFSAYPYRVQYLQKALIHAHVRPLSQWTWWYLLSPIKF